jgi:hypothetical protein
VSDHRRTDGDRRWYEKFGVQINRPPPAPPPPADYVRPSRWNVVAPGRIVAPASFGVYLLSLVVLGVVGVPLALTVPVALMAAFSVQYTADGWWRRNRPPSADRPRKPAFSKDPDDYR